MTSEVFIGDVREFAATLAVGSVAAIVTSPPYWGLREYPVPPSVWGGDPDCAHAWGEGIRAPWANELPGPNGRAKNGTARNAPKNAGTCCQRCDAWRGCLGLEPTVDLFIAHLVEVFRALRPALADDGSLWLNLGDCYAHRSRGRRHVGSSDRNTGRDRPPVRGNNLSGDLKHKDLVGVPWLAAFALRADGWYLRSEVIWEKTNALPESVKDRPTRAHEHLFLLTKRDRYHYDAAAIAERVSGTAHSRGRGANPKLARAGSGVRNNVSFSGAINALVSWRNRRTVWRVPTAKFAGAHTSHFPPDLIRPCILAGVRPGAVVCDPFMGTGTVAQVAVEEGRRWVGCDLDPDARAWTATRVAGRGLQRTLQEVAS